MNSIKIKQMKYKMLEKYTNYTIVIIFVLKQFIYMGV